MTRRDSQRLRDIIASATEIADVISNPGPHPGRDFDTLRIRLLEISEALKSVDPELLANEPSIPWSDVIKMRDRIAHRYFDTAHGIIYGVAREEVPVLVKAIQRLLEIS